MKEVSIKEIARRSGLKTKKVNGRTMIKRGEEWCCPYCGNPGCNGDDCCSDSDL